MPKIQRVAVVGAGLMGSGIAEVSARAGYDTIVREVDQERVDAGKTRIERSLARAVERGRLEGSERDDTLTRLSFTTELSDLSGTDIIIEAVTEEIEIDRKSTRLNSSHVASSYAVFCLKKKNKRI